MAKPFKVLVQYLCPQRTLSRLFGLLANCRIHWFKNWGIKRFIRIYHVDMSLALSDKIEDYPTFNSFFTRALKPDARPIALTADSIVSPADGCISQLGQIKNGLIFQAKNFDFSLTNLLGGKEEFAKPFINGTFSTIYLAPKDYHRVHMPYTGTLKKTIFIPGRLFSVNSLTTQHVPNLFACNERLVCLFETDLGPMIVILVGAMLVSSINTIWQSDYSYDHITEQHYPEGSLTIEKGLELGHFKMGSTVITLFTKDAAEWAANLQADSIVQMGQLIGTKKKKG